MLRPANRSSSSTSAFSPDSAARWAAISENVRGVITLAGSFARARARLLHAARMYPRAAARSADSRASADAASGVTIIGSRTDGLASASLL